jgi:GTPase SAR1 family protein
MVSVVQRLFHTFGHSSDNNKDHTAISKIIPTRDTIDLKIIVVGAPACGKTAVFRRYMQNRYSCEYIAVERGTSLAMATLSFMPVTSQYWFQAFGYCQIVIYYVRGLFLSLAIQTP